MGNEKNFVKVFGMVHNWVTHWREGKHLKNFTGISIPRMIFVPTKSIQKRDPNGRLSAITPFFVNTF
jgi:hypothetical protein